MYVSNLPEDITSSTKEGTSMASPEINLMDAIKKAKEIAAPNGNAEIIIYLYKGMHFILRDRVKNGYHYNVNYRDDWSLNYNLTIKPLPCSEPGATATICTDTEKVTIVNKLEGFFTIEIGDKLIWERIIVDSLESSYPFRGMADYSCTTTRENNACCKDLDTGKGGPNSIDCSPYFPKHSVCYIKNSGSLFTMM